MFNPQILLPIISKDLPGISQKDILQGIADFQKQNPKLDAAQALAVFRTAMKHPEVQKAMKTSNPIGDFMSNKQVGK